jgi:hypothetical protein
MSQKVNAVPDPSFSVPPLTTVAGSRVSRRRVKIPSNNITATYSPSNKSSGSSSIIFDIADNESFLDMDKSMMTFDFTPFFMNDANQSRYYPVHSLGFDGSSQSLMATVRIGNSQGLIIEELQAYATFANIMESYTQSDSQSENSFYDYTTSGTSLAIANKGDVRGVPESSKILHSHVKKRMYLKFKHSSFLKSCRMVPLFLMRNGIRIQVDLQDSFKLFTRKLKPDWQGPAFAHKLPNSLNVPNPVNVTVVESSLGSANPGVADEAVRIVLKTMDWYCIQGFSGTAQNTFGIVVKKESRLAQILNLRNLTGAGRYMYDRANTGAVGTLASVTLKTVHDLTVPLKIVYTDEFGVDKVYYQGLFTIDHRVQFMTANPQANHYPFDAAANIDGLTMASETISFTSPLATVGQCTALTSGREEVYYLEALPITDGFPNVFLQRNAPFSTADQFLPFMPYARFQPRIYADTNDLGYYVPAGSSYTVNQFRDTYTDAIVISSASAIDTVSVFGPQGRYSNRAIYDPAVDWSFQLQNVEMLCDFVKPSSEVFLQFQQAFQAPAGIPYAFKRVLYKSTTLQPSEGYAQIPLPVSVRSLRGVLVVLSDVYANSLPATDATRKHFPAITAFQKRGLSRAQLVIGGQNYPSYDLNITELGLEQIPELECLFNVSGLGGFNPSFDVTELLSTCNYAVGLGKNGVTQPFAGNWTDINSNPGNMGVQEYHDTSKFVLGLSTMKKDGDFVTGVDTSQSGSVYLNLQFKLNKDVANGYPGDFGGRSGRQIFLQCFAICDAVFTLQNDANLVRY